MKRKQRYEIHLTLKMKGYSVREGYCFHVQEYERDDEYRNGKAITNWWAIDECEVYAYMFRAYSRYGHDNIKVVIK